MKSGNARRSNGLGLGGAGCLAGFGNLPNTKLFGANFCRERTQGAQRQNFVSLTIFRHAFSSSPRDEGVWSGPRIWVINERASSPPSSPPSAGGEGVLAASPLSCFVIRGHSL